MAEFDHMPRTAPGAERARLVQQYRSGDRYTGVETVWKRKDGRGVPVRLSGRVLHDETLRKLLKG
jgi:hypothetical protein